MSNIVVADKFRKIRINGKYVDESPQLQRKGMKVQESYVESVNVDTKENGVYMVIDEEATKAFKKEQAENSKEREIRIQTKGLTAEDLVKAFSKKEPEQKAKTGPKNKDAQ